MFNMGGGLVAMYFYYPRYSDKANQFYACLVGSLIYGGYLSFKVIQIIKERKIIQTAFSRLNKDDYLLGSIAIYLDKAFIVMVIVQVGVSYLVLSVLPTTPINQ